MPAWLRDTQLAAAIELFGFGLRVKVYPFVWHLVLYRVAGFATVYLGPVEIQVWWPTDD
jgi:hypothetical protein